MINRKDAKKTKKSGNFEMMTVKEIATCFKISIYAVRDLIRKGYLPAFKIDNGEWRVLVSDYESYVTGKLTRYEHLRVVKATVFKSAVLDKYKKSPDYYVHDEPFHGTVGLRRSYFKSPDKRTKDDFAEVIYQKVRDEKEGVLIVVQPEELKKIPPDELAHWYRFLARGPK